MKLEQGRCMQELESNPYNLKECYSLNKTNTLKHLKPSSKNLITYSWNPSTNKEIKNMSHKICGHVFEAFELLERYPNSVFMIPDTLEIATRVIKALYSKYKKEIVDELLPKIVYGRPTIITCQNVLICDGQLPTGVILRVDVLRLLLCSKDLYWAKDIANVLSYSGQVPKIQLCFDERLQYPVIGAVNTIHKHKPDYSISLINYKKNINFNLYKDYDYVNDKSLVPVPRHTFLVYATGNCRDITKANKTLAIDTYQEIIDTITSYNTPLLKEVLMLGTNPMDPLQSIEPAHRFKKAGISITFVFENSLPIDNLFELFDTYIYTPTAKNWDCSSRLIPECRKFNKDLLLTKTVKETLDDNLALNYRILDYYPEIGVRNANPKAL